MNMSWCALSIEVEQSANANANAFAFIPGFSLRDLRFEVNVFNSILINYPVLHTNH